MENSLCPVKKEVTGRYIAKSLTRDTLRFFTFFKNNRIDYFIIFYVCALNQSTRIPKCVLEFKKKC